MSDRQYAQEWFDLGKSDLEAAQFLMEMRPKPNEIIAYHCQQAVEKYLKGFLVLHEHKPPRTHDLLTIIEKCAVIDASFEEMSDGCIELTEYAVDVRYPSRMELQDHDVMRALKEAKRICLLVENLVNTGQ